jgi:hypothetical protein
MSRIPKGEVLVDLGAGYCRGTLLSSVFTNFCKCISYEFVEERARRASEFLKTDNVIIIADLNKEKLREEYAYYLYFPRGNVLNEIIKKLYALAQRQKVTLYVCESHGDVLEYLDALMLLERQEEFPAALPRHYDNIVAYKFLGELSREENWRSFLSQWLLFHGTRRDVFFIKYYSHKYQSFVEWLVPVSSVRWVMYRDQESLECTCGRVIEIHRDEPILRKGSVDDDILKLLSNPKYKKIFIHDGVYNYEF